MMLIKFGLSRKAISCCEKGQRDLGSLKLAVSMMKICLMRKLLHSRMTTCSWNAQLEGAYIPKQQLQSSIYRQVQSSTGDIIPSPIFQDVHETANLQAICILLGLVSGLHLVLQDCQVIYLSSSLALLGRMRS